MDVVVINVYREPTGGERECSICLSEVEEREQFRRLPVCGIDFMSTVSRYS